LKVRIDAAFYADDFSSTLTSLILFITVFFNIPPLLTTKLCDRAGAGWSTGDHFLGLGGFKKIFLFIGVLSLGTLFCSYLEDMAFMKLCLSSLLFCIVFGGNIES
jgi:hypothetical protein